MNTVSENVRALADEVRRVYVKLLTSHAQVCRIDRDGGGVVWVGPDRYIEFIDENARLLQSRILRDLDLLLPLTATLLRGQSDRDRNNFEKHADALRTCLEPGRLIWEHTMSQVVAKVTGALEGMLHLIGGVYDPSPGKSIIVPDTNALLYNPALESWRFAETSNFVFILVPAILSELDSLKVNHRNEDVRKKAERLIRTIKGYRGRGSLTAGVPLVNGVSDVVAVATEPVFSETLPWLDESNCDDRLLAATIEVMRTRSRSAVMLVTRDINLQTKAEYARVPFVEPPEPVVEATATS